jgi:hypothetical protein
VTSSDAPQPPGGPLREDQPDEPHEETEQSETEQSETDAAIQEENAETSLDQPSQ